MSQAEEKYSIRFNNLNDVEKVLKPHLEVMTKKEITDLSQAFLLPKSPIKNIVASYYCMSYLKQKIDQEKIAQGEYVSSSSFSQIPTDDECFDQVQIDEQSKGILHTIRFLNSPLLMLYFDQFLKLHLF